MTFKSVAWAAFALVLVAGRVAGAAADPTLCAIPSAMPIGSALIVQAAVDSAAAEDEVAAASRLVAEGRTAEARTKLKVLEHPGKLPNSRELIGWSLFALAAAAEGDPDAALMALGRAQSILVDGVGEAVASQALLNMGWAYTELGDVPGTRRSFDASAVAAQRAGLADIAATALTHRALLEGRIGGDVLRAARAARDAVAKVPDAALKARLGVTLGLALLPDNRAPQAPDAELLAHDVLSTAYAEAAKARDGASLSHALGLLGELQLARGDARSAAGTLDRAVLAARALPNDPWRFRWAWKRGLALRATGDISRSLVDLQESVDLVEAVKTKRSLSRFSYSTLARDYRRVYLDLADGLLRSKEGPPDLARVRATMELSRTAEIEDFFRDPCLAARSTRVARPELMDPSAAIIHPILFDDRIEILVSHSSGIVRFNVAKDSVSVAREVQRLRNALERPGSDRFRVPAARLNSWLVAPIESHLQALGVKTLVWVPAGALRGVPFAALHGGSSYLIERYAIAVTPVATLTDPRPIATGTLKLSLSGLTKASQGFAALPGVAAELDTLSAMFGVTPLRDEQFTVAALQDSLRRSPATAVHVASHGQFAPEAGHTFLLTHDGRLTLPQLRAALAAGKVREEPLELIVLSACQTAAGDERAALGIAGVAISAGARSSVATLWAVSDESTVNLISRFYNELLAKRGNRASALREAQLALLRDERFSHPFFWAPYLLIGNWM